MILIVDMNSTANPFGFHEFVLPIVSIAEELENCTVKHYIEVNETSLNGYDKIILSGSALKDTVTFSQTARFKWLKECGKPVLGICAGMQTIGLVFGCIVEKCREIGMIEIATSKDNFLFSSTFNYGWDHLLACSEGRTPDGCPENPAKTESSLLALCLLI